MTPNLSQLPAGLIAGLENTRIVLPLKALVIDTEITSNLVSVELDQIFLQDNSEPLNCTFTFPLPADAAVHRCEMHVGDRVIAAKVMARRDALRVFEEKRNEGHRAALANMDRDNLFNLDLGNLQPGDLIRIRFAYVQRLDQLDDLRSLRIPLTPGVRYVPGRPLPRANLGTGTVNDTDQVPDASRISPPRIDALHPDAATFHARVKIDASFDQLTKLRSPSHAIDIEKEKDYTIISLSDDEQIPNQDFVVEWATKPCSKTAARAWVTTHKNQPYALLELDGGPLPEEASPECRDVYILLDRSGSMGGEPWQMACQAVNSFAEALPATTRIDLTLFESNFTHLSEQPRPAEEFLKLSGKNGSTLTALGTTGGTDLAPALDAVFARRNRFSGDRPAVLLLITDGMIANENALRNLVRNSNTTLHLVAIGFAPNDVLRSVAEATGGQAVFSPPNDEIKNIVSRFASRLSKPLFENVSLPPGWSAADQKYPISLYPLEQRLFILQGEKGATMNTLKSECEGLPIDIQTTTQEVQNPAIPLLWARDRIRTLEQSGCDELALGISTDFNLPSSQTSFVAWDRKEHVAVAARHLHQPSLDLRKERILSMKNMDYGIRYSMDLDSERLPSFRGQAAPSAREKGGHSENSYIEDNVMGSSRGPISPVRKNTEKKKESVIPERKALAGGILSRIKRCFLKIIRKLSALFKRK